MIVGDLRVDGLSRGYWHVWPAAKGVRSDCARCRTLDLFQIMMQLRPPTTSPCFQKRSSRRVGWLPPA